MKINRLKVVSLSYLLMLALALSSADAPLYYFGSVCACVCIVYACSVMGGDRDTGVAGYAGLNFVMMILCYFNISPANSWAEGVLYSPTLNYSIIVFCYELFMICTGAASVLLLRYNRDRNDNSGGGDPRETGQKVVKI